MKKNLFYLFALICSMSLFTACSDDDDETMAPVEGTWQLAPLVVDDISGYQSGPISVLWTGDVFVDMGGMPLPIAYIYPMMEEVVNKMLTPVLTDFTLKNKNLSATVNGQKKSANGLVTYSLSGTDQILLKLDLTAIIGQISGSGTSIDPSLITGILGALTDDVQSLIKNGIPVNYKIEADGNAEFFIDKSLISRIAPLMPLIANLLPAGDEMLDMAKPILVNFPKMMEDTDEIKISLKVVRPATK